MPQEVSAKLRFFRVSPRKARLVADLIRGRRAEKAVENLSLLNKRAAGPILKLLRSAMANAMHNYHLAAKDLRIAKITVDGGPVLKRWRPRAHGRAAPIRKPTSHIDIVLRAEEQKE